MHDAAEADNSTTPFLRRAIYEQLECDERKQPAGMIANPSPNRSHPR